MKGLCQLAGCCISLSCDKCIKNLVSSLRFCKLGLFNDPSPMGDTGICQHMLIQNSFFDWHYYVKQWHIPDPFPAPLCISVSQLLTTPLSNSVIKLC